MNRNLITLISLVYLLPLLHSQEVVRSVESTNALKLIDPTSVNPVRYVIDLGFFIPKDIDDAENGTNTFRSTYNTNYLWVVGGGTGNISVPVGGGTNALADGNYGHVTVSGGGTNITVNSDIITDSMVAADTITTNKVNSSFRALLGVAGPAGADGTDGADGAGVPPGGSTGQVLAKASAADNDTEWVTVTGVTNAITGSVSVSLISTLASTTGASGAVAIAANGFNPGDGGGSAWEWSSTGTTNLSVIYGGTSGHYWKLRPLNGWVSATALGMVGSGSTDNATTFASILSLSSASNWSVFLPAGTYNLGSMIASADLTNITLRGVSPEKTILYWTHSGSDVEGWRWTGTGGKIRINNIAFKANPANDVRLFAQNGNYTDVIWNGCEFTSSDKIWYAWQSTSSVKNWGWENCWFHGTTNDGASAVTWGSLAAMSRNVWLTGNKIDSIGGSPFELYQIDGIRFQNNVITNYGFADTQQPHAIYCSATTNTELSNVDILYNKIGHNVDPDKHLGVSFIQLYDHKPPHLGIHNVRIIGNTLGYGNGTSKADGVYVYGSENVLIQGNIFTNIHSVAVAFGGSTKNVTIDNNDIYGAGTAEYGIKVGATSTAGYYSDGHIISNNRIQGFLRESIGFGGKDGIVANNIILLTAPALEANYSAIQLSAFTGHAVDLVIKGNVIHDLTTAPTYSWGGISMGKAARILTNMTTIWTNSASTTSGHLVIGNTLNDVAGAPLTAGSGNKVYENTRLGTCGANVLSATVRNND